MPRTKKEESTQGATEQAEQMPNRGKLEYDPNRVGGKPQGAVNLPDAGGENGGHEPRRDPRQGTPMIPTGLTHMGNPEPDYGRDMEPEPDQDPEPEPEPADNSEPTKTLTQSELDAIIKSRLERETRKYADYDDLKTKVEQMERANMSETDKLRAELDQVTRELNATNERNRRLAVQHAIDAAATKIGLDVNAAFKLADLDRLDYDPETGDVVNADDIVRAVANEYPALVRRNGAPTSTTKPANPDKSRSVPTGRTDDDRRREYFGGRRGNFWSGGGVVTPDDVEI